MILNGENAYVITGYQQIILYKCNVLAHFSSIELLVNRYYFGYVSPYICNEVHDSLRESSAIQSRLLHIPIRPT